MSYDVVAGDQKKVMHGHTTGRQSSVSEGATKSQRDNPQVTLMSCYGLPQHGGTADERAATSRSVLRNARDCEREVRAHAR